jgi:DNA-binding protein H-NS
LSNNLSDLLKQREALEAQIKAAEAEARTTGIAKVRELMQEYGLTIADIAGGGRMKQASVSKVAAKYRNTETGDTWSGRGLQPKWLKAAIAGGKTLQDFAI